MSLLFVLLAAPTWLPFVLQLVLPAAVGAICFVSVDSAMTDKKPGFNTAMVIVGIIATIWVIYRAWSWAHNGY